MSNRLCNLIKAILSLFETTLAGILKIAATAALPFAMRYYFASTNTPKYWDPGTPYWRSSVILFLCLLIMSIIEVVNDYRHEHLKFKFNKKTGVVCDPDNQIPQVTLRCATVRKILHSIPVDQLRNTGVSIGCDFVSNIGGQSDITEARKIYGQRGSNKTLQSLLSIWAKYDSETGMGLVSLEASSQPQSGKLQIKCTWDAPFTGNREDGLCDFLEGYCNGCIKSLVNSSYVNLESRQDEGTRLIYNYTVPS